ncbi:acyltransferase family protein [Ornithinicoccus hortensis]|uniref:Peptidoglycan/LPS O-acetylase OafA/YrhL n=1 Tax=Ornithinicoccus hortensis TaxID=82346 RepID=A0A542YWT0_9MICO|nr:acyltransferase family protein [Ornithinicoccus hortensis]TQL52434.1 peptidoglycan/LPS O-acetylase OafA/YrhL [Ornithinicoccus hortensis]
MAGRAAANASFRPDIEGLRAVAVLMVLAFHAGVPLVPGGFAGVDVFFVISGFLITGLLVREVERSGRVSLTSFYARRAKRLLPAASLVLVVTGVLTWLFVPRIRWAEIGGDLVGSAVYLINWRLADRSVDYLAEDSVASPVQHYWSLAVEEQFYIVWPLLMVLGAWLVRRHGLRTRPLLGLLLAVVVLASLTWSVVQTALSPQTAYFVTTTRLWELGIGSLVALTAATWQRLTPTAATALAWAGVLALLGSAVLLGTDTAWPGYAALLPTLGTSAVIAGGFNARAGGPVRFLGSAPMRGTGALSYSLYLWHWPLLVVAAAAWGELALWQGIAISLFAFLPARLTYVLVEDPVRTAAVMARVPVLALAVGAACTVVGAGAGFGLVRGMESSIEQADGPAAGAGSLVDRGDGAGETAAVPGGSGAEGAGGDDAASRRAEPREDPAEDDEPTQPADPAAAGPDIDQIDLTPESITPDPLLAIEDVPSIYPRGCAGSVGSTEVIRCDGGDPDGDLVVALAGDSKIGQWGDVLEEIGAQEGWAVRTYNRSGCPWSSAQVDEDGSCARWGEQLRERLLGPERPDVVIVSGVKGRAGEGTDAERTELMAQGYVDYWTDLGEAGIPVVVLADTPAPGELSVYECVSEHRDDVSQCTFERGDGSGTRPLRRAAEEVPTATFISMNDWICPLEECPPVIGDVLVYRQGSHITNTYAMSLIEPLRARLVPAVEEAMATVDDG